MAGGSSATDDTGQTMANPLSAVDISETMAAPLGDLIAAVGRGLAEAQQSLDQATIDTIKALYSGNDSGLELMRQLGWQPTWYRIPELAAELTISLSVSATETSSGQGPGSVQLYASPMDASYTNRYDYDLQAASVIKFKIVPVPPTVELAERKLVPALKTMKLSDARQRLASLGIPFQIEEGVTPTDATQVQDTNPPEGALLAAGEKVTLLLYR
jgi:hypothetical protein